MGQSPHAFIYSEFGAVNPSVIRVTDICMSPRAAEAAWADSSGILDVDGNVNAWGLYWRLASGSTIFKVESEHISAYTEHAVPFVHYVPIAKVRRCARRHAKAGIQTQL